MRRSRRNERLPSVLGAVLGLVFLAALASPAAGKGLQLSLTADPASVRAGEPVAITLRGVADPPLSGPCTRMRVVVVAPGVSVTRALRSLEGGVEPRRVGRWGAFRLASLRPVAELHWTGRLRPNAAGRWTLVVPNWCAGGFVLPGGVERLALDVRPTG